MHSEQVDHASIVGHDHSHSLNRYAVIPSAEKLNADSRYSGRKVRIAFLDSGFYPHPDFIDRVIAFRDISGSEKDLLSIKEPSPHHWHGTQTLVSSAGNGRLSGGIYRGIAHDAELILVKVSENGRIGDEQIEKGLRWIIANRQRFGIRILNMSLGGDVELATRDSRINQLAEELVEAGVVVTVAAGNAETCTLPPASAPSVITVGGYSDENQLDRNGFALYHSAFGSTKDGNFKPEIVAPAMYVAAPILPNTTDFAVAESLSLLTTVPDYKLANEIERLFPKDLLGEFGTGDNVDGLRTKIYDELERRKIIATHYQHVDGTSFAAPITASVVAQMLEANPGLTPRSVKDILIRSAERVGAADAKRQGFGILNANEAVRMAVAERHELSTITYRAPLRRGDKISFVFHDDRATTVHLVGDFNGWSAEGLPFQRSSQGLWTVELSSNERTILRYKFLVDGHRWIEDPTHGRKEEDGLGGFHSIIEV